MSRSVRPVRAAAAGAVTLVLAASAAAVAGAPAAFAHPAPAQPQATTGTVVDGAARFAVLTPTLIRLEYAGDGVFQDATTLTVTTRALGTTAYTTDVSADGYREIRTSALTLRYRQGSGPFTPANLSVLVAGTGATGAPAFPSYCAYGSACEAENGLLRRYASTAYDHTGHTGSGFVAGFEGTGSGIGTDVSAVPAAGQYRLAVRYANALGSDNQNVTRTLSTTVNGAAGPTLTLPPTGSWDTWGTASVTVTLAAGTNSIGVVRNAADSGRVNLDSLAVTATGSTGYPAAPATLASTAYGAGPTDGLGGWYRSLDNPGTVPVPEHPGILDRDGWYLLDDTRTALMSGAHAVTDRPSHGRQPYQDGYLFGYGHDYKQGLADLNALTGAANLLPRNAYGVWFSRYFPYTTADYENTLLPRFRSTETPLDWLVVDTDWKSPSQWNGWNWNPALFPDPPAFLSWSRQQGLSVTMNIHPSISGSDPKFAAANAQAGGRLTPDGSDYGFDWSDPAQQAAYFNLHQPFEQQGVRAWWLDACTFCGASFTSDPQVAPDNLINQGYADDTADASQRGFSFARIGGYERGGISSSYPVGPWSERRNTLQFTGDTPATWDMLAFEARFTADEASAGLTNVSHDIGSFHGGHLADDMYARWVQLGTFQPVDRLHSDHGDRLPWDYTGAAAASAERFLRLRESLVPYTYTLAAQASATGVPIVRPMYLDYPDSAAAYQATGEYLYGDSVLVAPITTPNDSNGNGSTTVWVPPGSWTDYFTGTTYTGPGSVTVSAPLSRMPVLVKAGGILPTRTDFVANQSPGTPLNQLTLNVAAGADGTFALYQDAGDGTGYRAGQSTSTPITWSDSARALTVGATTGTYPGAVTARSYTLRLSNSAAPTAVTVDGVQVPETAWSYNAGTRTVTVVTAALPTGTPHVVGLTGTASGNPAAGEVRGPGGLCLDVRGGTAVAGQPVQLYTCNHSAAQTVAFGADGTLRVLGGCLDAANGATGNGTLIQWYTCDGTGAQAWTRRADGSFVNPASGRCLDDPSGNTTPGAVQLQLRDCAGGVAQTWQPAPGPVTGPGGLCVDVADADPASGTAMQLFTCNGTDAQRLGTPGDGTVRVFGKCLDVLGGGTGNGTPVQLWDCNGSAAQTWVSRPDGSLGNPASGRCLDDPDNAQHSGDPLRIYDCNGTAAQGYRLG